MNTPNTSVEISKFLDTKSAKMKNLSKNKTAKKLKTPISFPKGKAKCKYS